MSKKTAEILKKARALLAKRGGWIQNVFARTAKGKEVPYDNRAAASFCAWGATARASGEYNNPGIIALERVARIKHLPVWQDKPERTKREILALFDRAIRSEMRRP